MSHQQNHNNLSNEQELTLLTLAMDAASDHIFLMDESGYFVYANETACRALGYSRDELRRMRPPDIDPNLTPERFEWLHRYLFESGSIRDRIETQHRAKNGRTHPVELTVSVVTSGNARFALSLARDISERKAAERRLEASELNYRNVTENSPENIIRYDRDGLILYLNKHLMSLLGVGTEIIGKHPLEVWPDGRFAKIDEAVKRAIASEQESILEFWASIETIGERCHQIHVVPERNRLNLITGAIAFGRDVTELRQAEARLRESEQQFRSLVENAPDNIMRTDRKGRVLYANPVMLKTWGANSLDDVVGLTPYEIVPDAAGCKMLALLQKVDADGTPVTEEIVIPVTGGLLYHSVLIVPEYAADGTITGALTIGRDITRLKLAEQQIHASEQAFRALAENSPDAIARYDRDCRRLYVNPATARLYGLTVADLLGKPVDGSANMPGAGSYVEKIRQVFASGREETLELTFRNAQGELRWGQTRLTPEFSPDGAVSSVIAVGRDIHDLKESIRRFYSLAENIPDNIMRTDREGRIRYANPVMLKTKGVERLEEIWGRTPFELNPNDAGRKVQAALQKVDADGTPVTIEITLETPQGLRHHSLHIAPEYNENGEMMGALTIGRDITEIRQSQSHASMLSRALDHAYDCVYLLDDSLHVQYVNESATRVLGYSRDEFMKMNLYDIDPDVTPEIMQTLMEKTLADGVYPGVVETRHRRKDGSIIHVEIVASIFEDDGKKFHLTVARDITERKRAERELHLLNRAVNATTEAIYLMDERSRFFYVNQAACEMLGYRRDQLLGKTVPDINPDITQAEIEDQLHELFEQGSAAGLTLETRHRRNDGQLIPVEIHRSTFKDGDQYYSIALVRDMTERRHMENELRQQAEFRKKVLDSLNEIGIQLMTIENGRFMYVNNRERARHFGITDEEMDAGFSMFKYIHPDDREWVAEQHRRRFAGEEVPNTFNLRLIPPSGELREYEIAIADLRDTEPHTIVAILNDVTEKRQIERESEHTQLQLQQAHRMLARLTSRREQVREEERKHIAREIHDELGQHLSGLRMGLATLRIQMGANTPSLQQQIATMTGVTDQAIASVRHLVTALRPSVINMGIRPALEWLGMRLSSTTQTTCTVHCPSQLPEIPEDVSVALFRICQEAITNITRHADARHVALTFEAGEQTCHLQISDDGRGFDPAKVAGNSFGLLGIRERTSALGGELIVNSRTGKGTVLSVTLPMIPSCQEQER